MLTAHTKNPRATQYIPQMVATIQKLIENGKAYVHEGEVIYSIDSFAGDGKLSAGRSIVLSRPGIDRFPQLCLFLEHSAKDVLCREDG